MIRTYPDSFKSIFAPLSIGLLSFLATLLLQPSTVLPAVLMASYFSLCAIESLRCCISNRNLRAAPATALLMPLHHFAYALGFLLGLLGKAPFRKGHEGSDEGEETLR